MKNTSVEDFYELEQISSIRLHPMNISGFFLAVLIVSGISNVAFAMGLFFGSWNAVLEWKVISMCSVIIYLLQILITVFFSFERMIYRFQKLQTMVLCFLALKFIMDFYMCYFLMNEDDGSSSYMTPVGLLFMFGGFIVLILSTRRAIGRVRNGEFREGGNKLFDFQSDESITSDE